ncbi:hypothetical protein CYMTET_19935 [Cymbomonas tetramitiformis]|uniref:SET domain-containing protein n=1 Tax=Cymbomonas tetramitiformis TaxID=36881 RepID=A0AAE0G5I9_9CHLO|nr:hypothetical protein CYMTET_19935 [Cymbomonas tetramitiformis]
MWQFGAKGIDSLEKLYNSKYTYEVRLNEESGNKDMLVIDSEQRKSILSFLNDRCVIVDADHETRSASSGETIAETAHQRVKHSRRRQANALFFEVECAGCEACRAPFHKHILVQALVDIPANQELLIDYGQAYHRKQAALYSRLQIKMQEQRLQAWRNAPEQDCLGLQGCAVRLPGEVDANIPHQGEMMPTIPYLRPNHTMFSPRQDANMEQLAQQDNRKSAEDVDLQALQKLVHEIATSEPEPLSHAQLGQILFRFVTMMNGSEGEAQVRRWKTSLKLIMQDMKNPQTASMIAKAMLKELI